MTYNPQYLTIPNESQFKQPTPSEKDKIRSNLTLAMLFFFIAAIVFMIAGAYYIATYSHLTTLSDEELQDMLGSAYRSASHEELSVAILSYLITGIVLLLWGIIGLVFAFFTRVKALSPVERGEFEEGGRFINLLIVMGFVFGLVIAGIFCFKSKELLKRTAVRSPATSSNTQVAPAAGSSSGDVHRCQICNSMMTFNAQTRMWYCTSCNRYQM